MANKLAERSRFTQPLRDMLNDDIREWFVGVDRMFDDLALRWEQAWGEFSHFPASTVERVDDTHYRICLSVPGYEKENLTVNVVGGEVLVITGDRHASKTEGSESSSFEQRFLLADTMRVDSAKFSDGTLNIDVSFPEATWAKEVPIRIE